MHAGVHSHAHSPRSLRVLACRHSIHHFVHHPGAGKQPEPYVYVRGNGVLRPLVLRAKRLDARTRSEAGG